MARIRSIKPQFWLDQKLATNLTRDQRLFYIGLWNQADDEGRFLANARLLLGAIFPHDRDLDERFTEDSLRALAAFGRIVVYTVDGERYGAISKWSEHQKINRPTASSYPKPPNNLEKFSESSVSDHGGLTVGIRNKEEGNGVRKTTLVHADAPMQKWPAKPARKNGHYVYPQDFETAWARYPQRGGGNPKVAAYKAFRSRVRAGDDVHALIASAEHYAAYCAESGKESTEFVARASTFWGPGEPWLEYVAPRRANGDARDPKFPNGRPMPGGGFYVGG